ncbi:radical SAM protein [Gryllotalpicola sp.]|uniref:radical SAM protein n=1 Tax=Gryllotalpicola sp. TaxID=1932787 RepID=UPI0026262042|nr:radical SAM protein [Gryllotalpicola sp.]
MLPQPTLSRYAHVVRSGPKAVGFNSLTLEAFDLAPTDVSLLESVGRGEIVSPELLEPLIETGFLRDDVEADFQAIQRIADSRRERVKTRAGHFGTLRLSITEKCNMSCTYCFQQKMYPEDEQPVLSREQLTETLNWFIEQGRGYPLSIQYFGGEPLLEWDNIVYAHEMLSLAVEAGTIPSFRETVTTNGTLLSGQRARWLVDSGFDLTFSFDGPPEVNDINRLMKSGRGSFGRAMRGLRSWVEEGGRPSILMTATAGNVKDLPEYVRWFVEEAEVHPKDVGVNSPQPTSEGWETGGTELADAIWAVWKYCRSKGIFFHGPGTYIPTHLQTLIPQTDGCVDTGASGAEPSWPVYVSAEGKKSLCVVYHRDERVMADPQRSALEEGSKWHYAAEPLKECDSCIASQICGGPCALEKILWQGRLNSDRCDFMRQMTKLVLLDE